LHAPSRTFEIDRPEISCEIADPVFNPSLPESRRQAPENKRNWFACFDTCTQDQNRHTSSWLSDYSLAKEHEQSCDRSKQLSAVLHRLSRGFRKLRPVWGGGIIATTSPLSTGARNNSDQEKTISTQAIDFLQMRTAHASFRRARRHRIFPLRLL